MRLDSPLIANGSLVLPSPSAPPIAIGSDAWWAWLDDAEAERFRYAGAEPFTARREARAAGNYWYAHRRRNGQLVKTYLGRSAELTAQRLAAAAEKLAGPRAESPPPSVPQQAVVARRGLPAQPTPLINRSDE